MPTLLVIDDNEFAREVLKTTLEKRGYKVVVASGGEEGLRLAESQPVDGAIVDIYMPGMDGFVACGNLQALGQERHQRLPVWLITGSYSAEAAARGTESGALHTLRKPINFPDLFRRMEEEFGNAQTGERKPETGKQ